MKRRLVNHLFLVGCAIFACNGVASEIFVEDHFIEGTKRYPAVSPALMKIISKAESSGTPNTLSTLAHPNQAQGLLDGLNSKRVSFKVAAYDSKRYIFSIYPSAKQLEEVFQLFRYLGIDSYDIGLMQVNSHNAKRNGWNEVKLFTDIIYNIDKSAMLLNDCMNSSNTMEASIECYNKGSRKAYSYSYYKKIFKITSNRNK